MSGSAGQEPRSTKKGKSIFCKTNHFVPLVGPGLSTNSGSSLSSTTPPQESLGREALLVSGNRAASSSSSDPVWRRSGELANRRLVQESPRSDKKDANDPLADLPFWFEDFTDNLDPTEVHAPAHISQDSDSEHPAKVATNSRKHSIFTYLLTERPRLRRLLENQNNKDSLQTTHWRSSISSRKVWWLVNGKSQSPQWGRWITKQSPVRCHGFSLIRVKRRPHMRLREGCQNS